MMSPSILQSSVLCRGGLYRRTWRPQYHVFRTIPRTSHGGFHSKTLLEAGEIFGLRSANGGSLKSTYRGSDKYFMITSSIPSITKYQDILDQLSRLLNTSRTHVGEASDPAVLILATPTFATWLENGPFMGKVLETIFPSKLEVAVRSNSDVTALLAVTDGLPSGRKEEPEQSLQITEGFAFLTCDRQLVLPELWQRDNNNAAGDQSNNQRSSIMFRMRPNSSIEAALEIGVPLASTIFRNGRTSTLLASKWNRSGATGTFEKIQQLEKTSVTVYLASSNTIVPLHLQIPVVPLTPLRRVVSGLGNIVRQVTDAEDNIVSASQELEASVDSYLKTRSLDKQTVTVWALIIPNSIVMDKTSGAILATDPEKIRASWTDVLDPSMGFYVGHWLDQGRGATLHRVLSGGGGWGLKQGLLSLDPEKNLVKSVDARHDFDSSDSADDDQVRTLGNIAEPGSWIQFLISHNPTPNIPIDSVDLSTAEPGFRIINNLSFGCISSTVDHMPPPPSYPSVPSGENDIRPSVDGFDGHFGAMSEAGIFISATKSGDVVSSKIDVPNSNFQWAVVNREKS